MDNGNDSDEQNIAENMENETDLIEPKFAEKVETKKNFGGKKKTYFVNEKLELAQLIDRYKKEYDEEKEKGEKYYDTKKRKWKKELPKQGYVSRGQLFWKCLFGVIKSPKNEIFLRISDLASKKSSNQKLILIILNSP